MSTPVRNYQGASAQARVQGRRQRLINVAFEAMASDEWKAMSINQLCRLAELNKRYFYESFDSLDAIAAAVVEDLSAKVIYIAFTSLAEGNQAKLPNLQLAKKIMREVLGYLLDDPRRSRVLFGEVADTPVARANRRRVIATLANTVADYGHVHYEAGGETYPLASVASSLLVGGTIEAILNWLDNGIPLTREEFIDDIAMLWHVNGDGVAAIALQRKQQAQSS